MKSKNVGLRLPLLAALVAGSIFVFPLRAQTPAPRVAPVTHAMPVGQSANHPPRMANRARMYYDSLWGVDSFVVRYAESGEMIRFSYRVVDADKAKALADKKIEPALIDPGAGVKLVVPSLEKVGALRQSSTPEAGKSYWMAFSNSGRRVKRGDRVDVVIGQFRAQGLVVE